MCPGATANSLQPSWGTLTGRNGSQRCIASAVPYLTKRYRAPLSLLIGIRVIHELSGKQCRHMGVTWSTRPFMSNAQVPNCRYGRLEAQARAYDLCFYSAVHAGHTPRTSTTTRLVFYRQMLCCGSPDSVQIEGKTIYRYQLSKAVQRAGQLSRMCYHTPNKDYYPTGLLRKRFDCLLEPHDREQQRMYSMGKFILRPRARVTDVSSTSYMYSLKRLPNHYKEHPKVTAQYRRRTGRTLSSDSNAWTLYLCDNLLGRVLPGKS